MSARVCARRTSRSGIVLVVGICLSGAIAPGGRADGPAAFLVDQLSIEHFKSVVFDLAALESRFWRRASNTDAENYIYDKLVSFGYTNVVLDEYTYSGYVRHNIYATRMGTVRPTEMYIIGAHLDSYNKYGNQADAPGADDDASGVAAVLEAARVFARAHADVSVRFALWNNEETGLNGSRRYVVNHRALQGTPEEPIWLGMIQLDMILYDHWPGPVPDADVEYQAAHDFNGQAILLADSIAAAMSSYGAIPAEVGDDMRYTDSVRFWNDTAAISIRENRRIGEIGANSNPHWHEPTDLYETYSEQDYEFGFNIVKMLVGGVGELAGDYDVDVNDLLPVLMAYASCDGDAAYDATADINSSGCVDISDLGALLADYGYGM